MSTTTALLYDTTELRWFQRTSLSFALIVAEQAQACNVSLKDIVVSKLAGEGVQDGYHGIMEAE